MSNVVVMSNESGLEGGTGYFEQHNLQYTLYFSMITLRTWQHTKVMVFTVIIKPHFSVTTVYINQPKIQVQV